MIESKRSEALKILYEKYLEFRGYDLHHIAKQCKIIIRNSVSKPKNGWMVKKGSDFIIMLPYKPSSPEMEQIIGFHELAHALLYEHELEWRPNYNFPRPRSVEAWCDNFSLAMILELHKQQPLGIDDYETFFRQGEGLERLEESDPFLARKILSYFIDDKQLNLPFLNETVVNLAPGCHPLIDLARELLIIDE